MLRAAGGGKSYRGIKAMTMEEALEEPTYAARIEGKTTIYFKTMPEGMDAENPEHLKMFSQAVQNFLTVAVQGKTFLERRAAQLVGAGFISRTEAAKYTGARIVCGAAKPISTFGGPWSGKGTNSKAKDTLYIIVDWKDRNGAPFSPNFLTKTSVREVCD